MSVIMTYLLRFLCLCNYKIGYGSAWSNWKQEFYLPLRSPFAIFAENRMRLGKPGTSSRFLPAFTIFVEEKRGSDRLAKVV